MENFEHDVIRAGLLFFNGLREVDLRLPGFGTRTCLLASPGKRMCVGGSANLAKGIIADIEAHDGEIQCNIKVSRILLKNGKARIELSTGEQIHDRVRCLRHNPQQTFLQLIPESECRKGYVAKRPVQYNYSLHCSVCIWP